jgi:PAS domain S-box-containing protein
MTSRRYLLYVALALLAAHAAVLEWRGDAWPGPVLSDFVQLLIGVLVFFACLQAMGRSLVFGRLFWKLAATALFLWCVGQALGTYYGSYLNLPTKNLWHVDIFYVAWPAPLVMCLFLDTEEEQEGADWRRLLDFGQVAIVFVLIYFYFSALPSQGAPGSAYRLSVATDGLVTAAFFARAFSLRDDPAQKLFLGIGAFRAVALLTDLYFAAGLPEQANGAWFDLVWSAPWLIPLVTATDWTELPRPQLRVPEKTLVRRRLLLTHVLPLIFPVLVVAMAANIAPTQLKIAALAVLLSLATSYARLLLTHGELRRSAEALRDHHQLLNAIIEGTTAATYVKDLQGRYLLMNSAGAAFVGKSAAEILGKDDAALFSPESAQRIIARDRQTVESGMVQTYEEETTVEGVTRTYLSTKGPFRDAQGRVVGLVGSSLDVTDRYHAIEALAESEERFRTVFDGSPVGMAVLGKDGSVVASNSACRQMLGLGEEDLREVAVFDELTHPEDRAADSARFQEMIRGKIEYDRREKRYILRDGRRVFADLHLYLVRDKKGAPRYIIGIAVDVSERKFLESQLRQAQRMETIGRLAGGVAHDFNNLLTVIKGYCDLLLERKPAADASLPQLQHIAKAAEQAASLTRQLLAFSRQQVMQPKVFSLNTLVWNTENLLRRLISEDVEMVTITAKNIGAIKADPGQIEQVILNLVINARDAMPDGGKLTLETANVELDAPYAQTHFGTLPGSYVMLAVSDTGMGMDEETQAHIFEPFFTTKELGKGTGLGLSMVYGIVKQSGGYIWVHSEIGKGSAFKVYLPRVFEHEQEIASPFPASTALQGKETILLVEDDPLVRDLAVEILESRGYSVLVADHPDIAIQLCRQHTGKIHLVLTDVIMPGRNGSQMVDEITAMRPGISVLFMSGYTDTAIMRNGNFDQATSFLQKPFSPTVLGRKVREMLDHLDGSAQNPA